MHVQRRHTADVLPAVGMKFQFSYRNDKLQLNVEKGHVKHNIKGNIAEFYSKPKRRIDPK